MQSGSDGCHLPRLLQVDTIQVGVSLSDVVWELLQVTFTVVSTSVLVVLTCCVSSGGHRHAVSIQNIGVHFAMSVWHHRRMQSTYICESRLLIYPQKWKFASKKMILNYRCMRFHVASIVHWRHTSQSARTDSDQRNNPTDSRTSLARRGTCCWKIPIKVLVGLSESGRS